MLKHNKKGRTNAVLKSRFEVHDRCKEDAELVESRFNAGEVEITNWSN